MDREIEMQRPEFGKVIINDRVRTLRKEAENARRVRIAKALKR
ncbi:hypothetical protein FHX41_4863 [Actinomadura hallensis]|uniref:Uncharacterized protein n=1 Tax=Actinomadura hallensis TaxID=337895 RepID=A0A543IKM6_9ACTN|nr:hypothetical protein [Actinomadura hallensis]TQM71112.1 hypothetical protein FHX41_4863 [Actinomadura hallensis]HLV71593.1 hypothetical protein [Vulgatibacteraceae bacterium]